MKKTVFLYITDSGRKLAERLASDFPGSDIVSFKPGMVGDLWNKHDTLVFIMASGIVVRTISLLLKDKKSDPAVVVLDEQGKFSVSLVSGHIGGANELARKIAGLTGGEAVITTASDVNNLTSIDLWALDNGLIVENWDVLPQVGTRYVNNAALRVYSDIRIDLPDEFLRVIDPRFADAIITNRRDVYAGLPRCSITGEGCSTEACKVKGQLYLRPINLVAGIGCNSGTTLEEIEDALQQTLEEHNLVFLSLHSLATIDKKESEPGLLGLAEKYGLALRTFSSDVLNMVPGLERSEVAFRATGAYGVAEPAALLASEGGTLVVTKQKKANVTVAIALMKGNGETGKRGNGDNADNADNHNSPIPRFADSPGHKKGSIKIVGTGPGNLEHITPAARNAIAGADVIVGYGTYLDLIAELLKGKTVVSTGMTQEADRCSKAIELARDGKNVAVISGGDPGVYAMAGLVFEILKGRGSGVRSQGSGEQKKSELNIEVIPGISALNAVASRLGAPLMHDFACISLSDRLTPWEMIEKRLEAAAAADFVIVLYNPRSKGRAGHINMARDIILKHRKPNTVVGIVKGAMRENEKVIVTDLKRMKAEDIDMQTTVIIGNSKTLGWNNLMITPRGYEVIGRGKG